MRVYEVEVRITKQEDGLWRAQVPTLPGCFVDAAKLSEAISDLQEVVAMFLDLDEEEGLERTAVIETELEEPLRASIPVVIEEHSFRRLTRTSKAQRRDRA